MKQGERICVSGFGDDGQILAADLRVRSDEEWSRFARYMISRSLLQGQRRAEEMREVVQSVTDAGIDALMSDVTAKRQEWAAQFRAFAPQESLEVLLDSALAAPGRPPGEQG